MTMYGIPLAPHEIDALPQRERIVASIEAVEQEAQEAYERRENEVYNEMGELKGSAHDLYGELRDLLDMLEHGNQDEIDEQVAFCRQCLERNKEHA